MSTFQKTFSFFFLSFLILGCSILDTADAGKNPTTDLKRVEALLEKQKYPEALSMLENLVSDYPSLVRGYRDIITCYNALGDPQGAVVFMESLFLENPETGEVCYGLGYALYNIKKYQEAKRYFEKAVKFKPNLAEAWNNCAVIYHFIVKDNNLARIYYRKAIEISKKTGNERVLRIAERNLAHLPKPVVMKPFTKNLDLEQFVNLLISRVDNKDKKGIQELVLGQKENSVKAMDWLLAKAMRYYAEGKREEEKATVLLAKLLEKEYRENHKDASLKVKLDSYDLLSSEQKTLPFKAERLMKEGIEKEKGGFYKDAEKKYKMAVSCYETLKDNKSKGLALTYLGDVYRKSKKYQLARKTYEKGLTSFVETGDMAQKASVLSSLGITYFLLGEHSTALDFFNRSLKNYLLLKDEDSANKVKDNIKLVKAKMFK